MEIFSATENVKVLTRQYSDNPPDTVNETQMTAQKKINLESLLIAGLAMLVTLFLGCGESTRPTPNLEENTSFDQPVSDEVPIAQEGKPKTHVDEPTEVFDQSGQGGKGKNDLNRYSATEQLLPHRTGWFEPTTGASSTKLRNRDYGRGFRAG